MQTIDQQVLTGERALFKSRDLRVVDSVFQDGESPLKESRDIQTEGCIFRWKYPFWYCTNVVAKNCQLLEMARSGMWYDESIAFEDCTVEAPKGFRRCKDVRLTRTSLVNAQETLWTCDGVVLEDVVARGDYLGKDSRNVQARNFQLVGNYCFDGGASIEIRDSRLLSKDSFWNCQDVTVRDSYIVGEYIGWNSRNLVFENCTIESLQGFCYIDGLVLRNCRLINTNLAFEYCKNIDVEVTTAIDSVKNPLGGTIRAASIGEVIWDDPEVDPAMTRIITTA